MKLLKIIPGLVLVAVYSFCSSCKREIPQVAPLETDLSSTSAVQIFSATVRATRNYVYVDGTPVSGATFVLGGVFPATAFSFRVNAGSRAMLIKDTAASTTQRPLNFTQNYEAGKSYTVFTYDTTTAIKQITVTNNIVVPTDTSSRLRFANFIYNTAALPNVDVYSWRKGITAPVFSNVATNQVTDFIPYSSGLTDTLYVYATGTTTPVLSKIFVTSLTPTRSYTSVYTGSFRGTKVSSVFATY